MTLTVGVMRPSPPDSRGTAPSRSWVRTYLPPQHGAWAMLVVPWLLGTLASTWSWVALPLLVGWLLAYLVSYYALQVLRVHQRGRAAGSRLVAPLRLYAVLLAPLGLLLVWAEPWLALAALALVPFTAVNAAFAKAGRERSWVNGVASVTAACLMAPVAYHVGGGEVIVTAGWLFAVCWLYFAGTVFFVKTMIRERDEPAYLRLSLAFHVLALVGAALLDPLLALPFMLYLVRAAVLPHRRLRPAQVGVVEIVNSTLLVATALVAL